MNRKDGKSRMDMLDWAAENYSPPAPQTIAGEKSSPDGPTSRPRLVAALMLALSSGSWASPLAGSTQNGGK